MTGDGTARKPWIRSTPTAEEGRRGRFAIDVPPVLAELGLAEVEYNPRNNRMRAI